MFVPLTPEIAAARPSATPEAITKQSNGVELRVARGTLEHVKPLLNRKFCNGMGYRESRCFEPTPAGSLIPLRYCLFDSVLLQGRDLYSLVPDKP